MNRHELNEALGKALGVTPEQTAIVTDDGGMSCCASVDPRNGPWYCERELWQWLKDQHAQGRYTAYVLSHWDKWPNYSSGWTAMRDLIEVMSAKGWHCTLKSPFLPGARWFCGFSPEGATGWNGKPDHEQAALDSEGLPEAVARAALEALTQAVAAEKPKDMPF